VTATLAPACDIAGALLFSARVRISTRRWLTNREGDADHNVMQKKFSGLIPLDSLIS